MYRKANTAATRTIALAEKVVTVANTYKAQRQMRGFSRSSISTAMPTTKKMAKPGASGKIAQLRTKVCPIKLIFCAS